MNQLRSIIIVCALVACGSRDEAVTNPRIDAGLYSLRSIDGKELPVATQTGSGVTVTVTAGQLEVFGSRIGNGRLTVRHEFTGSPPSSRQIVFGGDYTKISNAITVMAEIYDQSTSPLITKIDGTLNSENSIELLWIDRHTYLFKK